MGREAEQRQDPPFGLFAATFLLAALGQAFQDAQANSFVATVKSAHRWLGCIHASYAFGGAFGPLIATAIASSGPEHWTWFYAFPLGMAAINLSLVSWAFREDLVLRRPTVDGEVMERGRTMKAWEEMKATARDKSVWLLSMFYFFYLGVGVTAGGEPTRFSYFHKSFRSLPAPRPFEVLLINTRLACYVPRRRAWRSAISGWIRIYGILRWTRLREAATDRANTSIRGETYALDILLVMLVSSAHRLAGPQYCRDWDSCDLYGLLTRPLLSCCKLALHVR
jgi:MFS family permease